MTTDIVNKKVRHKKLGVGTVISQDRRYIKVMYENGEKEHNYLDAFKNFLEMVDDEPTQIEINKEIHIDCEAEASKAKKEAEQIERWKKYDEENKKSLQITRNHIRSTSKKEINDYNNVAFKCTYCDGGKTPNSIGFKGVCSNRTIKYNVEVEKKVWCSYIDCPCNMYLNGEISRTELESFMDEGDSSYICYESSMLRDWRAKAGTYHNGDKAGEPMRLKNVKVNSLCVLTTRMPYAPESERMVFAVFLVDETFEGNADEAGEVCAHPRYRIALTPNEAKEVLYWKYHKNNKEPEKPRWGSGLHRYLNNIEAVQILKDIVELKQGTKDEKLAEEFLNVFCKNVRINPEDAGYPSGALMI